MKRGTGYAVTWSFVAVLFLAAGRPAAAQAPAPVVAGVYRLDFAVHEVEGGKRVNSRNYEMLLEDGGKGSVRVGTRVPVPTGGGTNAQYNYVDVGFNLDCTLREREKHIFLNVGLEISDLAKTAESYKPGGPAPSIRQIRTQIATAVPAGQRTVVGALDDAVEKRRYELEVTAARVKP